LLKPQQILKTERIVEEVTGTSCFAGYPLQARLGCQNHRTAIASAVYWTM